MDHSPAGLLAGVTRLGARFHLRRGMLLALECARLARFSACSAGVDHQRAPAGDHVGGQVAKLGAVGEQVQRLGVLFLALSELFIAVVEGLIARTSTVLTRLEARFVHLVVMVSWPIGSSGLPTECNQSGGGRPEHSKQFSTFHDEAPVETFAEGVME